MLQTETKGASAPTKASQSDPTTERPLRTLAPRLDLFDREGAYVMYVDLPGVTAEEVELSWTDGELELGLGCRHQTLEIGAPFERTHGDLDRKSGG